MLKLGSPLVTLACSSPFKFDGDILCGNITGYIHITFRKKDIFSLHRLFNRGGFQGIVDVMQIEMMRRVFNNLRRQPFFDFQDFIDQMADAVCPSVMIEYRYFWLRSLPTLWNPQTSPQYLGDQQFAIEGAFFMRHDLKDSLYIPSFIQHGNRNDPFDATRCMIDIGQLEHIGGVIVDYQNMLVGGLDVDTFRIDQKFFEFLGHILAAFDCGCYHNRQRQQSTPVQFAAIFLVAVVNQLPLLVRVIRARHLGYVLDPFYIPFFHCLAQRVPLVVFCASGGARMQESLLSLFQMSKTSAALARLSEARIPFVSVMTDPPMGGVSASLAMLGDINIGEPGALIGFAGPRVIEQTVREKLPEGFQRSEFLLEHGAIDLILDRREMRDRIHRLLLLLTGAQSKDKGRESELSRTEVAAPTSAFRSALDSPEAT